MQTDLPTQQGLNEGILSPNVIELIHRLALPSPKIELRFEGAGLCAGSENMRRDSELLDSIRQTSSPILLVRTYGWQEATISLGKNQPEQDKATIHKQLLVPETTLIVTRPTGGRAILHGNDISFAFITNAPVFLKLSLKDSYCVFTAWLKLTLAELGYLTTNDYQVSQRDYLRSPLCFETKTPSDILTPDGKKLAGCAQARRASGILQHGSAFLPDQPLGLQNQEILTRFSDILFQTVSNSFQ